MASHQPGCFFSKVKKGQLNLFKSKHKRIHKTVWILLAAVLVCDHFYTKDPNLFLYASEGQYEDSSQEHAFDLDLNSRDRLEAPECRVRTVPPPGLFKDGRSGLVVAQRVSSTAALRKTPDQLVNTLIGGCVDTATGRFIDREVDLYEPISGLGVERRYVSDISDKAPPDRERLLDEGFTLFRGWHWNLASMMIHSPDERLLKVSDSVSGCEITFLLEQMQARLHPGYSGYYQCLLCADGSADDLEKAKLELTEASDGSSYWTMYEPNGCRRLFPQEGQAHLKSFRLRNKQLFLRRESKRDFPTGITWEFEHSHPTELKSVTAYAQGCDEPIHRIEREYGRNENVHTFKSGKDTVEYILEDIECTTCSKNVPLEYHLEIGKYLKKVLLNGRMIVEYQYQPLALGMLRYNSFNKPVAYNDYTAPMLVKKRYPDGSYLRIEYYDTFCKTWIDNKNHSQSTPTEANAGLVKALYAPSGEDGQEECIYEFTYEKNRVLVRDGCGMITEHVFDDQRRLIEESVYAEGDQKECAGKHLYSWGEGREAGKVIAHRIIDEQGSSLSYTSYQYDDLGNVIFTEEHGDFSGKRPRFIMDGEGNPSSAEVRYYTYKYEPDSHLLIEQCDSDGTRNTWTYHEGTNQEASQHCFLNEQVIERKFYEYDRFGNVCLQIQDNGSGASKDDLEGIGYRKILRTRCHEEGPHIGLIEEESESFLDPDTLQELNVKTHRYCYNERRNRISSTTWALHMDRFLEKTFSYDDRGNIIRESINGGNECFREYDDSNRVIRERSMGLEKRYVYNATGSCIEEEVYAEDEAASLVTRNSYNVMGQLVQRQHPSGNKERFFYDPLGRCKRKQWEYICENEGLKTANEHFQYDIFGHLIYKKNASGLQVRCCYNLNGQLTAYDDSSGTHEHTLYTPWGEISERLSSDGYKEYYTYNHFGKIASKTLLDRETGEVAEKESYFYDKGRLVKKISNKGLVQTYRYDLSAYQMQVCLEKEKGEQGEGIREILAYDGFGRCIYSREEGPGTLIERLYKYDFLGNRTLFKVIRGGKQFEHIEYCEFDGSCRLIRKYGESNGCSFDEKMSYNALGDLVSTQELEGITTKVQNYYLVKTHLPFLCRKTKTTRSDGAVIHDTFFGTQLVNRQVVLPQGHVVTLQDYSYDAYGKLIQRHEVPFDSQQGGVTGPGSTTRLVYDHNGHLSHRIEGIGRSDAHSYSWEYDKKGRLISWNKPGGDALHYEFDRMGRPVKRSSSEGCVDDQLYYDRLGRLELATNASNRSTYSWILNEWQGNQELPEVSQKTLNRFFEPLSLRLQHDESGAVLSERQPSGLTISYQRDIYDQALVVEMPGVHIKRCYRDRKLKELDFSLNLCPKFGQDQEQKGRFLIDSVDFAGRPLQHSLWMLSEEGQPGKKIIDTQYGYDENGRWTQKTSKGLLSEEILCFDAQGSVIEKERSHLGNKTRFNISYDHLGQLSQVIESGNNQKKVIREYAHNSYLQRTSYNDKKYVRGLHGEIKEVKSHASRDAFTSDLDGQILMVKMGSQAYLYQYDLLNRCVATARFTRGNGSTSFDSGLGGDYVLSQFALYRYDALGRRSSRLSGEAASLQLKLQYFVYDENQEIGSLLYDPDNLPSHNILSECDQLVWHECRVLAEGEKSETGQTLFVWDSTGYYATGHDMEGSIVMRIDPITGHCVRSQFFDEFGKPDAQGKGDFSSESIFSMKSEGGDRTFLSSWGYKGKRHDPVSGLVFFGQRDYCCDHGQWMSRDPLGEVDGSNLFQYLHNNPFRKSDPWGLQGESYEEYGSFSTTHQPRTISESQSYQRYYSDCMEQILDGVDLEEMKRRGASIHLALSNGGGEDDWRYRRTIVYINGICNQKQDVIALADDLARTKGVHVLCIYNPSKGFFRDARRVLGRMLHRKIGKDQILSKLSSRAAEVVSTWNYGDPTLFFSHSEGEHQTKEVRRNLDNPKYRGIRHCSLGGIDPDNISNPNHGRIRQKRDFLAQPFKKSSLLKPFSVIKSHSINRGSFYHRKMGEIIDQEMSDRFSF